MKRNSYCCLCKEAPNGGVFVKFMPPSNVVAVIYRLHLSSSNKKSLTKLPLTEKYNLNDFISSVLMLFDKNEVFLVEENDGTGTTFFFDGEKIVEYLPYTDKYKKDILQKVMTYTSDKNKFMFDRDVDYEIIKYKRDYGANVFIIRTVFEDVVRRNNEQKRLYGFDNRIY